MPENRKDTEIYIRKLHEMLPELKKNIMSVTWGFLGLISGENRSQEATWTYLLSFPKLLLFLIVNLENYLSEVLCIKVDLVMKGTLKTNIDKRILRGAEAV